MNELRFTGNQKRYLTKPKTKDIGSGVRLIFAWTDAELKTVLQLSKLGLLKRYHSSSSLWELTEEGEKIQKYLLCFSQRVI